MQLCRVVGDGFALVLFSIHNDWDFRYSFSTLELQYSRHVPDGVVTAIFSAIVVFTKMFLDSVVICHSHECQRCKSAVITSSPQRHDSSTVKHPNWQLFQIRNLLIRLLLRLNALLIRNSCRHPDVFVSMYSNCLPPYRQTPFAPWPFRPPPPVPPTPVSSVLFS